MKPSRRAVKTIGMRVLQLARTVAAELAEIRRLVFRGLDLHHEISVQRNDIKQQVELLRLPADFNRILAADERDQSSERKQGPFDVRHNGSREFLFAMLLRQAEHLEILGVLDQLPRQVALRRRQGLREIRLRLSLAFVEVGRQPVEQDASAPAVLDGPADIEERLVPVDLAFVDDASVMSPRDKNQLLCQLCG